MLHMRNMSRNINIVAVLYSFLEHTHLKNQQATSMKIGWCHYNNVKDEKVRYVKNVHLLKIQHTTRYTASCC